jgi:hypothetical protein
MWVFCVLNKIWEEQVEKVRGAIRFLKDHASEDYTNS